jgi:transcriptional regulator with XRE-family HTH domain
MNLGNSIKIFRKKFNISQADLAAACGITQAYLSQIENNKKEPNLSILKIIGEKLNVPLPILFFTALDTTDIPAEKRENFNLINSSLNNLIASVFTNTEEKND